MTRLGWQVERVDGSNVFIKRFPLVGGVAKLQRCAKLPDADKLLCLLNRYSVKRLAVEPDACVHQHVFSQWASRLPISHTPYLPTKTIRIDLTVPEETVFKRFCESKRRAVRRALKNNLQIYESSNIKELITVKNKSSGFFGFITTTGIDALWQIAAPEHAAILLAYRNSPTPPLAARGSKGGVTVGGVLLLFWEGIAYYWIAGATREGKKLFAPTLLVWEALKLSKRRGMTHFDFVGVWDERLPNQNRDWVGFTKFKDGFGGSALYYPISTRIERTTAARRGMTGASP